MIIKTPVIYDVSHWKEINDFRAISPRPYMMITKASGGVAFVDSKFVRFFAGMRDIGILRGCYHWFNVGIDGAGQARHFLNVVNGYITDNDLLILDVEEGNENASQLKAWFDTVRAARPRNRVLIYSRRNILEAIPLTIAQRDYFRNIPVWIAGYPTDPDKFDSIPNYYIPDPTRWGAVVLWQYSEHGAITGIVGDVDLNWISDTFYKILGGETVPPPQEEPMPDITLTADLLTGQQSRLRSSAGLNGGIIQTLTGPLHIQGIGAKVLVDGYYWIQTVSPYAGWVALTTSYSDVVYTPPVSQDDIKIYVNDVLTIHMVGELKQAG